MAFLLDHLPPQLHLVIASRADPALPLARLRARGELVEIRAADLRFTPDEAAAYLNEVMGLDADGAGRRRAGGAHRGLDRRAPAGRALDAGPRRRRRLHRRLRRRRPLRRRLPGRGGAAAPARGVQALPAADLHPRPAERPAVRRRHRRRAAARPCWRRWTAATCSWSRSTTAAAGTATTTSSPTCCRRACSTSSPTLVPELHRRASAWYERERRAAEAIRHALAAEDFERAADLIELAIPAMRRDRQEATLRGWLEALPDELVRVRPVLSVGFAGALLASGELEGVEARLRDAERWLDTAAVRRARSGRRRRWSSSTRRSSGVCRGRSRCTGPAWPWPGRRRRHVAHARRALDLAAPDDHLGRGGGGGAAGARVLGERGPRGGAPGVHRVHGEPAAGRARRRRPRLRDRAGRHPDRARPPRRRDAHVRAGAAARSRARRPGRCGDGRHARRDEPSSTASATTWPPRTQHLLRSQELGEHAGLPQNRYRWRVAMARIRQAEGDLGRRAGAARRGGAPVRGRLLPERAAGPGDAGPRAGSRRGGWTRPSAGPVSRACPSTTTSATCASSSTSPWPGCSWRSTRRSAPSGSCTRRPDSWQRLLAGGRGRAAGRAASSRSWSCRRSPTRLRGDIPAALAALERALALAEPEGYVRVFVDEGPPMAALLKRPRNAGSAAATSGGCWPRSARPSAARRDRRP